MTAFKPVPIDDIPEVATFEESRASLEAFKYSHKRIFDEYDQLVQDFNTKLEAADKVVRAREVSCGSWELYQQQTQIDVDALYDALGREKFLAVGGKLQTVTNRGLDKTKFNSAITRGDIPEKVVQDVVKQSPRYHAPKQIMT